MESHAALMEDSSNGSNGSNQASPVPPPPSQRQRPLRVGEGVRGDGGVVGVGVANGAMIGGGTGIAAALRERMDGVTASAQQQQAAVEFEGVGSPGLSSSAGAYTVNTMGAISTGGGMGTSGGVGGGMGGRVGAVMGMVMGGAVSGRADTAQATSGPGRKSEMGEVLDDLRDQQASLQALSSKLEVRCSSKHCDRPPTSRQPCKSIQIDSTTSRMHSCPRPVSS
jgi:hypothetical protein